VPAETEFCVVTTTCNHQATVDRLCDALLAEKLVACIQISAVQSRYAWKGEIVTDTEQLLTMKTRSELYPAVAARILALHDYETPQIIKLPVLDGAGDYLEWIKSVTF
jgi:periplasmic divalent cation tolerance protein